MCISVSPKNGEKSVFKASCSNSKLISFAPAREEFLPVISYHPDQKNIGVNSKYFCNFHPIAIDDANRIAVAITKFVTSPIMFKDGTDKKGRKRKWYRHSSCFVQANWIGLDFDEGQSLEEMTKEFLDRIHVIGTTKSHQKPKGTNPPCDRFRVFLKLPVTITSKEDYRAILRYYVNKYHADKNCVDAARCFQPCKTIVSVRNDGSTIPVRKIEYEKKQVDTSFYRKEKYMPPWVDKWLRFGVPQGEKNPACLKIGIWLTKCGYSHSEIVALIMNSPIPNQHPDVYKEVYETSLNGVNIALREGISPAGTGKNQSGRL